MTVVELKVCMEKLISDGHSDHEIVAVYSVPDLPHTEIMDIEMPTEVFGMNIPYPDWPIFMWVSGKDVWDLSGEFPKKVTLG